MTARTYFFVRHAEALHQTQPAPPAGEVPGAEWPLTERGERQARELARWARAARVERLVSSALLRARQTAAIVAGAAAVPATDAWPELDEIPPSVLRIDPRERRRPEWLDGIAGAWRMRRHARASDGTPAILEVEARVREVLARLDALPEPRIAVVGHGYWIFLMAMIVPGRFRLRLMTNCSITRVHADGPGAHRLVDFARPPSATERPRGA